MITLARRLAALTGLLLTAASCGGGITVDPVDKMTINVAGTGVGTVRSNDAQINCQINGTGTSGACRGEYAEGASVTLTATPGTDQEFRIWAGDCSGASTCQLTLSRNMLATATFVAARQVVDLEFVTPGEDGAAIITLEGPSILGIAPTGAIDLAVNPAAFSPTTAKSTILIRGNFNSGAAAVAKVTIRGIHEKNQYTLRVEEVAARRSGNYTQRAVTSSYSASLK